MEAEDIAKGTLNEVAQKGGGEDFSNLNAVLYYLHLFQECFYSLKLATSLTKSEQQLLVQYESVQASQLTKIEKVMQDKHLTDREKQIYLNNFLQFCQGKHDQDSELSSLYDRIAADHQSLLKLMKQQSHSTSAVKKADIESAV